MGLAREAQLTPKPVRCTLNGADIGAIWSTIAEEEQGERRGCVSCLPPSVPVRIHHTAYESFGRLTPNPTTLPKPTSGPRTGAQPNSSHSQSSSGKRLSP